jgi:hypothetical protein
MLLAIFALGGFVLSRGMMSVLLYLEEFIFYVFYVFCLMEQSK